MFLTLFFVLSIAKKVTLLGISIIRHLDEISPKQRSLIKLNYKLEVQHANLKTTRGFPPKYSLSKRVTFSQIQTGAMVPLNGIILLPTVRY